MEAEQKCIQHYEESKGKFKASEFVEYNTLFKGNCQRCMAKISDKCTKDCRKLTRLALTPSNLF
jgi:hypothetical protein